MSETLLPPACEATPAVAPSAPLRLDGAALLAELTSAAGSGADLGTDSGARRMARLDRVLRGCAPDWSMHRLAPELGLEAQPSRLVLKRRLDQLATLCPRVALVLLTAQVVEVWETSVEGEPSGQGELALVTDTRWSDHPEDCTLPLSWLVDRLATVDHEVLVMGLQLRGAGVLVRRARRLLEAGLVPGERSQLLVVHHVSDRRCLVEELQGGFAGAAANHLGEVTLEGLAEHCEERLGAWVSVSTGPHGAFVCPRPSMLAALEASASVPDREGETAGLGGGLHRKLRPGDMLPGRIAILGALGEGGHGAVPRRAAAHWPPGRGQAASSRAPRVSAPGASLRP